jgi:hypothetical protein
MPTVSRTLQVGLCALLIILSLFREIGDEKVLVQNPPGYVLFFAVTILFDYDYNLVYSNLRSSYKKLQRIIFTIFHRWLVLAFDVHVQVKYHFTYTLIQIKKSIKIQCFLEFFQLISITLLLLLFFFFFLFHLATRQVAYSLFDS